MLVFIIGAIGIVIVNIVMLIFPTYYSYDWGYASIGKIHSHAKTSSVYFTLPEGLGTYSYILLALVIAVLLLYVILMLTKNSNLVPLFVIFATALIPFVCITICTASLKTPDKYKQIGDLIIGCGTNAGISPLGIYCTIFLIIFYAMIVKGYYLTRNKIETTSEQETKQIKVKKKENPTSKNNNDFSL